MLTGFSSTIEFKLYPFALLTESTTLKNRLVVSLGFSSVKDEK